MLVLFHFVRSHWFLPPSAMHSADYTVARCPSVCLSICPAVCLSVTCRYCVETVEHIIKKIFAIGSHTILLYIVYHICLRRYAHTYEQVTVRLGLGVILVCFTYFSLTGANLFVFEIDFCAFCAFYFVSIFLRFSLIDVAIVTDCLQRLVRFPSDLLCVD